MIRKEISQHMESILEGYEHTSSTKIRESIEFLNNLIRKELDEAAYKDSTEADAYNECYEPSLRQVRTLQWCMTEIENGNVSKAYHYLFEYVDNYQQGANTEIKGFELQVIQLITVLLSKLI